MALPFFFVDLTRCERGSGGTGGECRSGPDAAGAIGRSSPLTTAARRSILNLVVKYAQQLDATFSALADPTRRAMLTVLMRREASVSELAEPHNISLPAVMKHLRVLEAAGLVSQRKIGRERRCRLTAHALKPASDWIAQYRQFWERQFDALDRYLAETQPSNKETDVWRKRKLSHPSN